MKLVIYDLAPQAWDSIKHQYDDCTVVFDRGTIRPCTGCFSCWNRTPGQCVIHDGYENMGKLIHDAEEVIVISRYTWGGFSSFVKGVFDRSLGYVLPQFELVNGESHHQKRYAEDKPFSFHFYGPRFTEEEKACAQRYVEAVCTNIRGTVKETVFHECGGKTVLAGRTYTPPGKTVLLQASMRNRNSARLAERLAAKLKTGTETIALRDYVNDLPGLVRRLSDESTIVLCTPLYVDGLPSLLIRLMECFAAEYHGAGKRIYVLANMGLYESRQLVNLFSTVEQWCRAMDFTYCGGLGISAGELIGELMKFLPFHSGPIKEIAGGMDELAEAIDHSEILGEIQREPYRFPRSLYIWIANTNWNRTAKKNGISPRDLYRRL